MTITYILVSFIIGCVTGAIALWYVLSKLLEMDYDDEN